MCAQLQFHVHVVMLITRHSKIVFWPKQFCLPVVSGWARLYSGVAPQVLCVQCGVTLREWPRILFITATTNLFCEPVTVSIAHHERVQKDELTLGPVEPTWWSVGNPDAQLKCHNDNCHH